MKINTSLEMSKETKLYISGETKERKNRINYVKIIVIQQKILNFQISAPPPSIFIFYS